MKHCPSCVSEFQDRPDLTTCPDCQVALEQGPSPVFEEEEIAADEEIDWETVYTTSDESEAYIVQGFLRENGILAVLESMKFHAQPVNLGLLSEIKILCPLDRVEEAKVLLEDMDSAYVCSVCGTACSILDNTCPNCGERFQAEGN